MNTEYDRLMREYNVPPGLLTKEEEELLKRGGIRLDDDEDDEHYDSFHLPNRHTQPRVPNVQPASSQEA